MSEFAQLDGTHLAILVALALIAAMTLTAIVQAVANAFGPSDQRDGDEVEDLLQKLIDYASDAHNARDAHAETLDRIAAALDLHNEREAGRMPDKVMEKPWPPLD
jgi:hypothetical protein